MGERVENESQLAQAPKPAGARGALQIERVPIADLHNDPANARKHGERNLDAIGDSLRSFGQVEPLVVQRGTGRVIGGNGRLAVMRKEGITVADVVYVDVDDHTATRLGIALNRTAELAEWDKETLASLLDGMGDADLLTTGFDGDELKDLLADLTPPEVVEDEAPAPLPDPVSKTGDLWELGGHRLLCGDSTKGEDVKAVMNGERAAMCFTDPPYNIDYGTFKGEKFKQRQIINDNMAPDAWLAFCKGVAASIKAATDGCVYVCHAPGPDGRVMASVLDSEMHCSTTIIWNKDQFTLGRGKYQNKHEPIWFGWVKDGSAFTENRTLTNVWDVPRPKASEEHPTMKPPSLCATAIGHASGMSDVVYEPFSGSGTTIIAAEQLGRKCYAIEIEPRYVDVAVRRWEKLTGKQATCNGQTFAQVAASRGVTIV